MESCKKIFIALLSIFLISKAVAIDAGQLKAEQDNLFEVILLAVDIAEKQDDFTKEKFDIKNMERNGFKVIEQVNPKNGFISYEIHRLSTVLSFEEKTKRYPIDIRYGIKSNLSNLLMKKNFQEYSEFKLIKTNKRVSNPAEFNTELYDSFKYMIHSHPNIIVEFKVFYPPYGRDYDYPKGFSYIWIYKKGSKFDQ